MDPRRLLLSFGVVFSTLVLVTAGSVLVIDRAPWTGQAGGPQATPPTKEVASCTTITEPGRYELTADIVNDRETHLSESCIRIESDDVVLDGAGHRVDGRSVSGTIGVHVAGSGQLTNVSVIRLTVSDWDWGIHYEGVTGGEIREAAVEFNAAGITLAGTQEITARDNVVSNNGIGVFLLDASDNEIRHNQVSANHLGVDCDGAAGNTFAANDISDNRATGALSTC